MLLVDRDYLQTFMFTLFKYADRGYLQFRAFGDNWPTNFPYARVDDWEHALDVAEKYAQRCADAQQNIVFCPPIATFSHPYSGKEKDVALGLTISVECDTDPNQARAQLEQTLGQPTIVVVSGGKTPDGENKLHLHWRLQTPTRTQEQHSLLKQTRKKITKMVQADRTNVPLVHPIRWPGSWHKKSTPRLSYITELTDNEIDLEEVVKQLGIDEDLQQIQQIGEFKKAEDVSMYGWAALVSASANIREAKIGYRYPTLNGECYNIGRLSAAGEIPKQFALDVLLDAARRMQSYPGEKEFDNSEDSKDIKMIKKMFNEGYLKPRLLNLESRIDGDLLDGETLYE